MVLTGYVRRVGGDLAPGLIIAPEVAALGDPALLAAHCLEAVDPALAEAAREGDLLVVAGALADGPGGEAAVIALQALGIAAVICAAAGPGLAEQGGLYGLPVLAAPAAAAGLAAGELVRVDLERGELRRGEALWSFTPLAAAALGAVRRAQLLSRMRRVVEDEGFSE